MTRDKATEVLHYAAEHADEDLRSIDQALITLIGDLQARVAELERERAAAQRSEAFMDGLWNKRFDHYTGGCK